MNKSTITRTLILSIALFGLGTGCSSGGKAMLRFNQDVQVSQDKKNPTAFKKGDTIEVEETPLYIESPGFVGLLLVPKAESGGEISVSLKPQESWLLPQIEQGYFNKLTEVLEGIHTVQSLLSQNKNDQAIQQVATLQAKFPQLTYLKFLEASCHFVAGNKTKAKAILDLALNQFPQSKDAQNLYVSLTGKAHPSATNTIESRTPANENVRSTKTQSNGGKTQ